MGDSLPECLKEYRYIPYNNFTGIYCGPEGHHTMEPDRQVSFWRNTLLLSLEWKGVGLGKWQVIEKYGKRK
jgi:hypothetical protein